MPPVFRTSKGDSEKGNAMAYHTASDRLRSLVHRMRAAHARDSQEWIRRMEAAPAHRPQRPW
jgi:hypothetical protein